MSVGHPPLDSDTSFTSINSNRGFENARLSLELGIVLLYLLDYDSCDVGFYRVGEGVLAMWIQIALLVALLAAITLALYKQGQLAIERDTTALLSLKVEICIATIRNLVAQQDTLLASWVTSLPVKNSFDHLPKLPH